MMSDPGKERGASAVVIASALVLLIGMAAIAIDIGAGFNERRQNVTAGDTGVMAAALEQVLNGTDDEIVTSALDIVRSNLDTTYVEIDWRTMWRSCSDPERAAWDPGTGVPISFAPLPEPTAWGAPGSTLDCISRSSSFLRVRIPDQATATTFGRVLGIDELRTSAVAVARIEAAGALGGLIPFGIDGNATAGEQCLKSSPSGTAYPPCQGPSAGSFGEINSEIFGDYFGTPSCTNPGQPELAQNIALGVDHFVDWWGDGTTNPEGITLGAAHPGDVVVEAYDEVVHDQCRINGGVREPQVVGEEFPANMLRVRTGFSPNPVELGLLFSTTNFLPASVNEPSRLQQGLNAKRDVVKRRQGANDEVFALDNKAPWEYLTGAGVTVHSACDAASYGGLPDTDARVAQFQQCLNNYSGTTDIFDVTIADSPRFAWAPQYWHALSTSGLSWQPVYQYRMVFIGGVWFNCDAAGTCGAVFYPDSSVTTEVCDPGGGSNCNLLNLNQMSAWMFPDEAIPDVVRNSFPGGQSPFEPVLFR